MPGKKRRQTTETKPKRVKPRRVRLTIHLTLAAYDAVRQLQLCHRIDTGRAIPIWELLDRAVRAYAEQRGIEIEA